MGFKLELPFISIKYLELCFHYIWPRTQGKPRGQDDSILFCQKTFLFLGDLCSILLAGPKLVSAFDIDALQANRIAVGLEKSCWKAFNMTRVPVVGTIQKIKATFIAL